MGGAGRFLQGLQQSVGGMDVHRVGAFQNGHLDRRRLGLALGIFRQGANLLHLDPLSIRRDPAQIGMGQGSGVAIGRLAEQLERQPLAQFQLAPARVGGDQQRMRQTPRVHVPLQQRLCAGLPGKFHQPLPPLGSRGRSARSMSACTFARGRSASISANLGFRSARSR